MSQTPVQKMKQLMDAALAAHYLDLEEQRAACTALLEIAQREDNSYYTAFAHTYLGDYFVAQNNVMQGLEHLQTAKDLAVQNSIYTLLVRIYNLFGICYESLLDDPSAVQYYLDALDLAEKYSGSDPMLPGILYNNIGNIFEIHQDYETAKSYYVQACSVIAPQLAYEGNSGYIALRLWSNLAEICRKTGQYEDARAYLLRCESLKTEHTVCQELALCHGWCCYYAALGDIRLTREYAERFLASGVISYPDQFLVIEMLTNLCHAFIDLEECALSRRFLDLAFSLCTTDTAQQMQRLQFLNVSFCERLGTEEDRIQAYRDYYRAANLQSEATHQSQVSSMKTILQLHEVTKEKEKAVREMQDFRDMANLDELTQLYNRRYFNKLLSKAVSVKEPIMLGFIMLDVDFFKEYNDTYGHSQGDEVLRAVALTLQGRATSKIFPCRYGGDEFLCLCAQCSDEEITAYIHGVYADIAALAIEHKASRCAGCVTLSVGYSNGLVGDLPSANTQLDAADQALYKSKMAGRNTYTRAAQEA